MGTKEDRARYRVKKAETHRWGKGQAVPKGELIALVKELSSLLEYAEPFLAKKAEGSGNVAGMLLNMRTARSQATEVLRRDRESKINRWRPKEPTLVQPVA